MLAHVFGPWTQWPEQDLVAFTTNFDEDLAVAAYCSGLFPMPLPESGFDEMGWWSPVERGILPLQQLRITRSLRKNLRRQVTTVDACFEQVLARCSDPSRPDGWIDDDIREVYTGLHRRGLAHSVETWDDEGRLVGGLYGVCLGGLFAGESMFHDLEHGRDASKTALVRLVSCLLDDGAERLLDVQWRTDHLASLGVVEVDRVSYLSRLDSALELPPPDWGDASNHDPLTGDALLSLHAERLAAARALAVEQEAEELDVIEEESRA
ncbi:leucyl/phenylalanyl-tRNA--protein transferase [Luteococcus sp.]|uniref:leucyl/phenylalanyl-tRNA--protein transferase n=1 Tax=Luteococcus sp. TaxID=1969402 RepID=UPI003736EB5D